MVTQYFFHSNIHDKSPPLSFKGGPVGHTQHSFENPTLTNFFTRTEQDIISVNTLCRKTYGNLILQEKPALNNLKNNQYIVIKPCDKGGGICIMDTSDYLTKIHTRLEDQNTYKPLTCNPTSAIVNDTCTLIEYIYSRHMIDKVVNEFLLPPKNTCNTSLLWASQNSQSRLPSPRVFGCDGTTAYDTHFTQPLASNLHSRIKDTRRFLNLMEKLPPLPPNAVLVTSDFTSLCTNIPHKDGIAAVIHFIEEYKHLISTTVYRPI